MPPSTSNADLSEQFADFFVDKITTIRNELQHHPTYVPQVNNDLLHLNSFTPLSKNDVKRIIAKLKTKSCELDYIPTKFLKEHIDDFIQAITDIVNISLESGIFATEWKTAILRPLLKKTGLDLITKNYRPVSNLSFISKVVETAAIQQLQERNIINKNTIDFQSAYKNDFSCETALIKLANDILWSMENKEICTMVCCDLSSAFDTICHSTLLKVLQNCFGVTETALQWFASYLQDRQFKVSIGKDYSNYRHLQYGVPQGSRGGPDLFVLYCSTIKDTIPNTIDLHVYADDHTIKKSFHPDKHGRNELENKQQLEQCMTNIGKWMNENRLRVNPSKTEIVRFGTKQQLKKCNLTSLNILNTEVRFSTVIRYLGAWFDEQLTFGQNVQQRCQKAMANLIRISSIRKFLDQDTCMLVTVSLVLTHLDYANGLLFGIQKQHIAKLQRIQNWAAKMVLKRKRFDSSTEALRTLHWLPIIQRIRYKIACLVYKCMRGKAPTYLTNLLKCKFKPYRLKNEKYLELEVPFVGRQCLASRAFSVSGPKTWNSLPNELRLLYDYEEFKGKLKTHLFEQYFEEKEDIYLYY